MGLEPELGRLTPPAELMDGRGWKELTKEEAGELWSLAFTSTALPQVAEQVTRAQEPALLARFAFQLAQKFNAFYHQYPILRESDPTKKAMRLFVVQIFRRQMAAALQLLGVSVPARM